MEKQELQQYYFQLTNQDMVQQAAKQQWPVRLNHCFQRIILDAIFQDCWYSNLDRHGHTPAYRQLTQEQLQQAIKVAEEMLLSKELVVQLNRQSLQYRGKLKGKTRTTDTVSPSPKL